MDGLYDTCDLLQKEGADDGAGGVKSTLTTVQLHLRCRRTRRTRLTDVGVEGRLGIEGKRMWRFSTEPVSDLAERNSYGDAIAYVIRHAGLLYDVLFWEPRKQRDGILDHMEFRAEQR